MRRFGADFRALTVAGTQAALAALFTAPLYGFVAPLSGTADGARGEEDIALPKAQKAVVYLCAIAGALSAFLILGQLRALYFPQTATAAEQLMRACRYGCNRSDHLA